MAGFSRPARRFSLVLLEEGEDYVADWLGKSFWPKSISGNWQALDSIVGTLRLCSKSIFFESEDVRVPIVRLPFNTTQDLEPQGRQSFTLSTTLVVKMKANMADAPYIFEKGPRPTSWRFSLTYASMTDFLPLVHQYFAASRMDKADRDEALQALAQKRASAAGFDTSRLVSFTETVAHDGTAALLLPLIKELGRLVITSERLYFQPLDNVAGDMPVRSHPIARLAAVSRRRSSLRPLGLEVFFVENTGDQVFGPTWGAPSAFFAFDRILICRVLQSTIHAVATTTTTSKVTLIQKQEKLPNEAERERVLDVLMSQPGLSSALLGGKVAAAACASILEGEGEWLQKVTAAWQRGRVTNLDYLLFCNLAAGRSFNDLTQWPVVPWVLADYESKELDLDDLAAYRDLSRPMGAMNAERLRVLQKRFHEMPTGEGLDQPFLYGTHYSCPGYVMFWLVRAAPGHLLRLQNGRFDSADRLFVSIKDSFLSATSHAADVKELIPEFFLTDSRFLVNGEALALGTRQNGLPVGDVELPRWARGASDFLLKHRAALESSVVSANLHHWIDLIFGYKQQGAAAEEADNVFHHLTYEGAVDIASVADPRERHALEVQINEFGQCPRQIFRTPHPARLVCPSATEATAIATKAFSGKTNNRRSNSGCDGDQTGHALSLALLKTVMAAISDSSTSEQPLDAQTQETLRSLDMLTLRKQSGPALSPEQANTNSATDRAQTAPTSSMVPDNSSRASGDRIREWGSNLGGHLSTFVGNLSREKPGNSSTVAAAQSRLRDLFQRQGGSPRSQLVQTAQRPRQGDLRDCHSNDVPQSGASGSEALPSSREAIGAGLSLENTPDRATDAMPSSPMLSADEALAAILGTSEGDTPPIAVPPTALTGPVQEDEVTVASQSSWGCGVRERLAKGARSQIQAFHAPVNGVACCAPAGSGQRSVYCVSQTGTLKIFDAASGTQVRSASLSNLPLTCVALHDQQSDGSYPTVIAGGNDNKIYAYSVEFGRILGSCQVHDDTVSSLFVDSNRLFTASHDGCVRVWSLAEGREPWPSSMPVPEVEIETDAAVHSLSIASSSSIAFTASEEGTVASWDIRSQQNLWQAEVSTSSIPSISLSPDGMSLLVATADLGFSVLDVRKMGACVLTLALEQPLLCCAFDGDTAIGGCQDGKVVFWDVGLQQGRKTVGGFTAPSPDGQYPPIQASKTAIRSLVAAGSQDAFCLVTGHEDGSLLVGSSET